MNVFISGEIMPSGYDALDKAGIRYEVFKEQRLLSQEELIRYCQNADGVLCSGYARFDRHFFESCPNIRFISLHSVGYDNVDIQAADALGIPVGHTPGVLSSSTADIAFLLMLATSRLAFYQYRKLLNGSLKFLSAVADLGCELDNKTLGIWGLGNIGMEMAKKCKRAYNMDIIYHNRHHNEQAEKELNARYVSFEELLQKSDVLSLHVNLSEATKDTFNRDTFRQMKKNAILVNTGRGGLVNETDLLEALNNEEIWGAGLDVTNPEPMDKHNPLLSHPRVCVLPHIGSATIETRSSMSELAAENVIAALQDDPMPHCVNPEVYGNHLTGN